MSDVLVDVVNALIVVVVAVAHDANGQTTPDVHTVVVVVTVSVMV